MVQMDMKMTLQKIDRRTATTKYKKNPFLAETIASVDLGSKTMTFGTGERVSQKTGEVTEAAFKMTRVVDKSQFLMLYLGFQSSFWQLSQRAHKVLRVIFHEAQYRAIGKDEIYLAWNVAEEVFESEGIKMSRATYFRGISELIEKRIIAESVRTGIFFLNPTLIFNGNRATFIQQIILNDDDVVKEAQEITATRALKAHRELSSETLKKIALTMKK